MSSLAGKKALVVDDNPTNLKVAMRMLKKLAMDATTVESGVEALALTEINRFDVILLDIQMPDLDGYQTARALRDREIKTPIIAYTAHALGSDIELCLQAGMDEHICKPMLLNHLEEKLLKVLGGND